MYSIAFPEMFSGSKTKLIQDNEATLSNMRLLLASWKKSLMGDPYFGTRLKTFIYEQNNIVLHDLIIDEIYVSLKQFIPQVELRRKDIKISSNGTSVYATINCINKLDNETNLYEIELATAEYSNWR
jgi:phage baseplate assembly protein W